MVTFDMTVIIIDKFKVIKICIAYKILCTGSASVDKLLCRHIETSAVIQPRQFIDMRFLFQCQICHFKLLLKPFLLIQNIDRSDSGTYDICYQFKFMEKFRGVRFKQHHAVLRIRYEQIRCNKTVLSVSA